MSNRVVEFAVLPHVLADGISQHPCKGILPEVQQLPKPLTIKELHILGTQPESEPPQSLGKAVALKLALIHRAVFPGYDDPERALPV